jgi:hypothetical protein
MDPKTASLRRHWRTGVYRAGWPIRDHGPLIRGAGRGFPRLVRFEQTAEVADFLQGVLLAWETVGIAARVATPRKSQGQGVGRAVAPRPQTAGTGNARRQNRDFGSPIGVAAVLDAVDCDRIGRLLKKHPMVAGAEPKESLKLA